jgi:restriction system protein
MRKFIRLMLGAKSKYSNECYEGQFIGAGFLPNEDLTDHLYDNWKEFNSKYRQVWLERHPGKTKVAAGLACGMLWTVCKGLKKNDIVLCPDGDGAYFVGEIESNYHYHPDENLPHRRTVRWYPSRIERNEMSQELKNSTGSIGTTSDVSKYEEEILTLIGENKPPLITTSDTTVEDASVFALEKHLEDFLIKNWKSTQLSKEYDIYEEDGELVGQQYPSDTGPLDILAISKDRKTLLVIELKKGRVSDNVVGQIQRYMGYVKEELCEDDQTVKGVIIGLEDDIRIKRALSVTANIEFYRYKVSFDLFKT